MKEKVMKRPKIMIGDYVYIKGYDEKPYQVDGIKFEDDVWYVRLMGVWYELTLTKPIPITEEILEKNGFSLNKYGVAQCSTDFHDLTINRLMDGSVWLLFVEDTEFGLPHQQVTICNVHQLQQDLRLFGTLKEIEL